MIKINKLMTWRGWIFWINLILILITAVNPYINNGFLKWNITNRLNLGGEMNLAAWWSGSLLLLCGVLAYQLSSQNLEAKHSWLLLAFCFALLSFDEIGSVHERAGNMLRGNYILWSAAAIGGILYSFACWKLWQTNQNRKGVLLIFVGAIIFSLAAPNEYIEHRVNWPYYLEGPRVAFEEGLEISGMFICLLGIAGYHLLPKPNGSVAELLLNSVQSTRLLTIITISFPLHIAISWIVIRYITVGFRGNPAVWYFMAVFLVLALSFSWKAFSEQRSVQYIYIFLFGYFLLLSAGSLYFVLPDSDSFLHNLWMLDDPNVFLGIQLIFLLAMYRRFKFQVQL